MNCDHVNCKTPFCPYCGTHVCEEAPIFGLLHHCRTTLKRVNREVNKYDDGERTVKKWTAWTQALEELIEGKSE